MHNFLIFSSFVVVVVVVVVAAVLLFVCLVGWLVGLVRWVVCFYEEILERMHFLFNLFFLLFFLFFFSLKKKSFPFLN